jgi:hypothetical protein
VVPPGGRDPALSSGGHGLRGGADLFAENLRRYRTGEALLHEVTAAD